MRDSVSLVRRATLALARAWMPVAPVLATMMLVGATSAAAAAQARIGPGRMRSTPDTVLVSPAWLASRLRERDLVVLFAGSKADYDAGHLPGARHFPASAFTAQGHENGHEPTLTTELPAMATLDSALQAVGVSDHSRVIIYGSATGAARLYVTLDHAGLGARASILDGGMVAWRDAGHPVTQDAPAITPGALTVRPRSDVIADLPLVRGATAGSGFAILDARLPEFYSGASAGQMPRAGHIPTARNLPYTNLLTRGTTFRDVAELQALFTSVGVQPGGRVITYCHIGMQASVLYVAAKAAGYEPRMYDGSFDEWSRRTELPVVRDSTP